MTGWVDPGACVACGICQRLAPAVFRVVGHRVAVLREGSRVRPEVAAAAWWAAEACPTGAIHLADGGSLSAGGRSRRGQPPDAGAEEGVRCRF